MKYIVILLSIALSSCQNLTSNERFSINTSDESSYQISDEKRFHNLTSIPDSKSQVCVMAIPTNRSDEMVKEDLSKWGRAGMFCSKSYT